MKRTEKNKENNISYLPAGIKLGLGVALLVVCSVFISKSGISLLGGGGCVYTCA